MGFKTYDKLSIICRTTKLEGHGSILDLTSQTALHACLQRLKEMQMTELNNALRMFVTSLLSSTLVPELRSFRPVPRITALDCGKCVFEPDNKVLNILFLMPI